MAVETLRPTALSGLTNLTGAVGDVDQGPDGTITDPGLIGDPGTPVQETEGPFYADNHHGVPAGFAGTLGSIANAVGSAETSQATSAGTTQNSDYGNYLGFDEAAIAAVLPTDTVIDRIEVEARQWANQAARGTVGIRVDQPEGTSIATEKTLTTLITTAPAASGSGTNNQFGETGDLWSATPTRAQLIATDFRVRVRWRRTGATVTYSLDWVRLQIFHTPPPAAKNTQADVALQDPVGTLMTGAATGEIKARIRKKGSGSNPQGRIEVRNAAGTLLSSAIADTTITESDADGQLLSATFNQSAILDKNDVVVRFVGTGTSGALAELVAIEWNAQVEEAALQPINLVGMVGIRGEA